MLSSIFAFAETFFTWKTILGGLVIATPFLLAFTKASSSIMDWFKLLRGTHPINSQFYKSLKAKADNTFQNSCDNIYDALEDCVSVSIAKVKNGNKVVLPDSEVNEIVVNWAGHTAVKEFSGKGNEHPLDKSFQNIALDTFRYGGALLKRDDLKTERYADFLEYIGADCVRIYMICLSDEVSYLLYVSMSNCDEFSVKEKYALQKNLNNLKKCFSKKKFMR